MPRVPKTGDLRREWLRLMSKDRVPLDRQVHCCLVHFERGDIVANDQLDTAQCDSSHLWPLCSLQSLQLF